MRGARILRAMLGLGLLAGLAIGEDFLQGRLEPGDAPSTPAWGQEAIGELAEMASAFALIGVANACGLGNSSCARCHDGRRAAAPPNGSSTGPWHRDHARVNNSCAACHQGNPRVTRQDVAHQKLVSEPLKESDRHCRACHKGAQADALIKRYKPTSSSTP